MDITPTDGATPCITTMLTLTGDNEIPSGLEDYTDGYKADTTMSVIDPPLANEFRATCFWDAEDNTGYFCTGVAMGQEDGVYEFHGTGYWKDGVVDAIVKSKETSFEEEYADFYNDYGNDDLYLWLAAGHLMGEDVGASYEPEPFCVDPEDPICYGVYDFKSGWFQPKEKDADYD